MCQIRQIRVTDMGQGKSDYIIDLCWPARHDIVSSANVYVASLVQPASLPLFNPALLFLHSHHASPSSPPLLPPFIPFSFPLFILLSLSSPSSPPHPPLPHSPLPHSHHVCRADHNMFCAVGKGSILFCRAMMTFEHVSPTCLLSRCANI